MAGAEVGTPLGDVFLDPHLGVAETNKFHLVALLGEDGEFLRAAGGTLRLVVAGEFLAAIGDAHGLVVYHLF